MDVMKDKKKEKLDNNDELLGTGIKAMPGTKEVPAQGKVQDVMTKLYSSSDQTRLQAFTGLA